MGGKLLSSIFNLPEKRISDENFRALSILVKSKLKEIFKDHRIEVVDYFTSKLDHDDLDIILESKGDNVNYIKTLESLFNSKIHRNGNVYSFPFFGFQVDICIFFSDKFDCACWYLGTEKGMMAGVLANTLGAKCGSDGLHLKIPLSYFNFDYPDHQFKEFLITRRPKEICILLDLSYQTTFNNKKELYEWIMESEYFRPESFLFENLNHQNRTRNKKRAIYGGFVDYLTKKRFVPQEKPDKEDFLDLVLNSYPDIQRQIDEYKIELDKSMARKLKFNGLIVQELTQLEKVDLGNFICKFKSSKINFDNYLDNATVESIKNDILNYDKLHFRL